MLNNFDTASCKLTISWLKKLLNIKDKRDNEEQIEILNNALTTIKQIKPYTF